LSSKKQFEDQKREEKISKYFFIKFSIKKNELIEIKRVIKFKRERNRVAHTF